MEPGISFDSQAYRPKPQVHFLQRDWMLLLTTIICTAGYAFLHPGIFSSKFWQMPGIGLSLSCWLLMAASMSYIGWKNLKWSPLSCFLLISTLLLSATYGIFAHNVLRVLNLPVLIILFALTLYALKGTIPALRFTWLRTIALHAMKSIPEYLPYPFRALINRLRSGNRRFKEILLGIGICIPVIGLIILLFCDADLIFGSLMDKMFLSLQGPNLIRLPWNLAQTLVLALIIFAVIYGLNASIPAESTPKRRFHLPKLTIAMLLSVMSFVYAAFVYIQCRYLFSGVASALIEDSYAVYARTGFFQLVIVAFITMLIVLPSLCAFPESRCLRTLCAFISLMTLVIVYSAFWRMRLYILEYGLTILRVLTLWGILAISAAMIASLIKAIRPKARILPVLFVFTIATWICFNYINVYDRIADYNIASYQNGTIERLDIDYLSRLGIEVLPQLEALIDEGSLPVESMGTAVEAKEFIVNSKSAPYDWSLSWLKAR